MAASMELRQDDATRVCGDADVYTELLSLDGKRIVELGCGAAENARAIAGSGANRSVVAFEVDEVQHAKNLAAGAPDNLEFRIGGAERIDYPDAGADIVFLFKSLHHVPADAMARALTEIARILVPGGHAYVSEPVFAGTFNEVIRIFHDEQSVREAAFSAVRDAVSRGLFELEAQVFFRAPVTFPDFETFEQRIIRATHTEHRLSDADYAEVRRRFDAHLGADGAHFEAPMRVDLLRKPDA